MRFLNLAITIGLTPVIFLMGTRLLDAYDEGIIATGAMLVSQGWIPHIDFYANYGPASFYLPAAIAALAGGDQFGVRWADALLRAITVVYFAVSLKLLIGDQYLRKPAFWLPTISVLLLLASVRFHGYPLFACMAVFFPTAAYLIKNAAGELRVETLLISGLLCGLCALFRYDVGFYQYVAVFIYYIHLTQTKAHALKDTLSKLAIFSASAALLPFAWLLYLYASTENGIGLSSFIFDIITWPIENFAKFRSLPLPLLNSIIGFVIYLPLIAALLVIVHSIRSRTISIFHTLLLAATLLFYLKGYVRISLIHIVASLVPAILMLAYTHVSTKGFVRLTSGLLLLAFLFITLSIATVNLTSDITILAHFRKSVAGYFNEESNDTLSPRASSHALERANEHYRRMVNQTFLLNMNRLNAVTYLRQRVSRGDRFYSGLPQHQKIFVNDVMAYSLLGALPVGRWHHFDPGLQNTHAIQAKMISDFKENSPQYILLDATWENHIEQNDSRLFSGVDLLDEYLRANYVVDVAFGPIFILKLKAQ